MNGTIFLLLFFSSFSASVSVHELKGSDLENDASESGSVEYASSEEGGDGRIVNEFLNSTLFKSVKRYYCAARNFNETDLLVFGTKAWNFPQQDVNLKLSYPTEENRREGERYIITGLMVILYIDGIQSRGYITSGGILTESINLSFVLKNISMLSYQFWLYGVPDTSALVSEHNTLYYMC